MEIHVVMEENKEQKKPKITILFGAGAEGKGQFGLPSGNQFKRDLIMGEGTKKFANQFLQEASSGITLGDGKIITANTTSVLYQTLIENEDALIELFPEDADRVKAEKYVRKETFPKDERETIIKEFSDLYKEKFYEKVRDNQVAGDKPVEYFLEHAGIYSYFDSLFNYLRRPDQYKAKCAKVIKIYYSALLSILKGFAEKLKEKKSDDFKDLIAGKSKDPFSTLQGIIGSFEQEFVNQVENDPNSETRKKDLYYYQIKSFREKKKSQYDLKCVTTNYTSIAQKSIDLKPEEIAYLHGKLTWFEELETKRIAGITEVERKKTVFPYLLVQSGIKPIISTRQIIEFAKATEWISESEHLLIIGYGINSDDEHITNFLRERLRHEKPIKVFVYSDKKGDAKWNADTKKMKKDLAGSDAGKASDLIEFYHASEFQEILDLL